MGNLMGSLVDMSQNTLAERLSYTQELQVTMDWTLDRITLVAFFTEELVFYFGLTLPVSLLLTSPPSSAPHSCSLSFLAQLVIHSRHHGRRRRDFRLGHVMPQLI